MAQQEPIRKRTTGSGGSTAGPSAQIPDKLYFRIGEVAKLCAIPAYVLRFWEGEFPQLKPNKGGTGQRLYRRRDVEMALRIKTLLYDEGYTIPGARQAFKTELRSGFSPAADASSQPMLPGTSGTVDARHLDALRKDLRDLLATLSKPAVSRSPVQPIRGSRGFDATEERAEKPRPKPPAPRPFPKPQLIQQKTAADRLHGLFDSLSLDD